MRTRYSTAVVALAAVFAFGLVSNDVRAADPSPATAPAVPDVVLLKGGGMLRGTIAELIPKKRVVIVLLTGEKRTISMAEVDYAGPASGAPGATAPAPAQPATSSETPSAPSNDSEEEAVEPKKKKRKVSEIESALTDDDEASPDDEPPRKARKPVTNDNQVSFDSETPGLQVYMMTSTATSDVGWGRSISIDAYSPLCTTPCTTSLPTGSYHFAVSGPRGKPVPVEDPVTVGSGDSVKVGYQSFTGMRVAGWVIFVGGVIAGTALIFTAHSIEPCPPVQSGTFNTCVPHTTTDSTQQAAGAVVAGGSALLGLIFILKKDDATAQVAGGPAALRVTPMRGEGAYPHGIAGAVAPGFGLSGTF